jgi:predicted HAD superfamily Cof-like phosphohydrolase
MDLLGDFQLYSASEMKKSGIQLDATLEIIMESNFSKQDLNGKPIYDERGKGQKGPNYWKPEPSIQAMLTKMQSMACRNISLQLSGVPS